MTVHPTDDLAAYALGALDQPEQASVAAHLDGCNACRAEVRAFSETAWAVAEMSARDAPARLRTAVVGQAQQRPRGSWVRELLEMLRRPVPVAIPLGLAGLLVIAVLGYGMARRDTDRYAAVVANAVGARVVPLAANEGAAGVRGSLVMPVNGAAPYLILELPPAAAGKTWEAWVIRGATPLRAGLTSEPGVSTLVLTTGVANGDTVAVTQEPAGGVDAPTGQVVLAGKS